MRGLLTLVIAVVGSLLLLAILIGMDVGNDNSSATVRAPRWADDVCAATGAWEGQIEVISDGVRTSTSATRPNDGGSGDHVEWTLFARTAITRAIQATDLTLVEGIRQAGVPNTDSGPEASKILLDWANETKEGLRAARATIERDPDSTTAAIEAIGYSSAVLSQAQLKGRQAYEQVAALNSDLEDALSGSDKCTNLRGKQP